MFLLTLASISNILTQRQSAPAFADENIPYDQTREVSWKKRWNSFSSDMVKGKQGNNMYCSAEMEENMTIPNTNITLEELLDRIPLAVQYVDKDGFLRYLNKTAAARPANIVVLICMRL